MVAANGENKVLQKIIVNEAYFSSGCQVTHGSVNNASFIVLYSGHDASITNGDGTQ